MLDGYASNISRCIDVDILKIIRTLKSHDSHILFEQLLPIAICAWVDENISTLLLDYVYPFDRHVAKW